MTLLAQPLPSVIDCAAVALTVVAAAALGYLLRLWEERNGPGPPRVGSG